MCECGVFTCLFCHDFAFLDCHRKPLPGAPAQVETLDARGQKVLHQRLVVGKHGEKVHVIKCLSWRETEPL